MVSESLDGTFRVWRLKDGAAVAVLKHGCSEVQCIGVLGTTLVYLDRASNTIHVWGIDEDALYDATVTDSVRYRNAKVVLVGDSGAGKSPGAGADGPEMDAYRVDPRAPRLTFAAEEVALPGGVREKREMLLWDLAGQPGYRLVHQLHLSDVALALVVFDARSDVDPLAGVRYWNRALTQARRFKDKDPMPLQKILVIARCDRGGVAISGERLNELARELGYHGCSRRAPRRLGDPRVDRSRAPVRRLGEPPLVGSNGCDRAGARDYAAFLGFFFLEPS